MSAFNRRQFMTAGAAVAATAATAKLLTPEARAAQNNGYQAATLGASRNPGGHATRGPGIQAIHALCEVTGGGEKVYGIAIEYDAAIDPASLTPDAYAAGVFAAAKGYFPGMPQAADKNATAAAAVARSVAFIYTNGEPALRADRSSAAGSYVIAEFPHDPDLSLPTTDSDKVSLVQRKAVKTTAGAVYAASSTAWTNAGPRRNSVFIRGVDEWEQSHWYWDDSRSAWLEYSIYLPKSFLKPGGEDRAYPLVLAITHSGTSYDGNCAQTLTEQCIASIWGMPEVQAEHECVVITPRYERTTMNDYWEHTPDLENTWKLVEFLLSNKWNFGNPNLDDRRDKVLKIDPQRVYCTGWSMGAMSSLWLMAKHPDTFAAGLVIAGQQRPGDLVALARQKLLIITGTEDGKATPWNEQCVPVWERAGGKVTRPAERLDASLIFPIDKQQRLTDQVNGYLSKGGNITFLTFANVDHMQSARKFFHIKAARDWLLAQSRA